MHISVVDENVITNKSDSNIHEQMGSEPPQIFLMFIYPGMNMPKHVLTYTNHVGIVLSFILQ